MDQTYYFYDLETSGINPAYSRIMQFAGQRTDSKFRPIGESMDLLVKLSEDVLPEPQAVLVHGITPQKANQEGISELELARLLQAEVFTPGTTVIGFNNIRFDDEFIRHLFWRNFYEPYEWHYKNGRSRWDLLDVTRMTRALRPKGLIWPINSEGRPTNRLVALAEANGFAIKNAHDAAEDIDATLKWAVKLQKAQPKLFNFLAKSSNKSEINRIINSDKPLSQPFIYSSGRYTADYLNTTASVVIATNVSNEGYHLVWNLRYSPKDWLDLSDNELAQRFFVSQEDSNERPPLPVKKLSPNRAPAVAPLGTLNKQSQKSLELSIEQITFNLSELKQNKKFTNRISRIYQEMPKLPKRIDPEGQLYAGFINEKDKSTTRSLNTSSKNRLPEIEPEFLDDRLKTLWLRFKARNYPSALNQSESAQWESWRTDKLINGIDGSITISQYMHQLKKLATSNLNEQSRFLLEELQLYAQSIAPPEFFI